jgi:Zn-finger nucleic acid-binding protein
MKRLRVSPYKQKDKETKMKDWVECQSCQAEFKVMSIGDDNFDYCPFCGGVVEGEEEDDLLNYDEDEEDYV